MEMGNTQKSKLPIIARIILILIFTLAAVGLALLSHQGQLPKVNLIPDIEFAPYRIGLAMQEVAIPVALIYLFSSTRLFQRTVNNEATLRDSFMLWGVLSLIHFLYPNHVFGLYKFGQDVTTFGLLIIITGGMLSGWKIGFGLGFVAMITHSIFEYLNSLDSTDLFSTLLELRQLDILDQELWLALYPLLLMTSAAVWAGLISGLGADLLGERRFNPLAALGLGSGVALIARYLMTISRGGPEGLTGALIPSLLTTGIATAVIALLVRNVQVEIVQRKVRAAEIAKTEAELHALRAQINPHFLFNTLNTIRYSVRVQPEVARDQLNNLAEIFRRVLHSGNFVPLRDEINHVKAYLALEKVRFEDRLQIIWSVQVKDRPDFWVPTLILQPLVENAIIHGISEKPEGGRVSITIEEVHDYLLLKVEDNGLGIPAASLAEIFSQEKTNSTAIGLRNIDGRLRTLYGEPNGLIYEPVSGGGTCFKIRIPMDRKQNSLKEQ
jgi:LytS/YehU family sensor histidine kinase